MQSINSLLEKDDFSRQDIIELLTSDKKALPELLARAYDIKSKYVGNTVYYRGIIEFSNICDKNCYYCGIRKDNLEPERYRISREEILEAAKFALENEYGSLVLQSGEIKNEAFTTYIESILRDIKNLSDGKLGITLSLGEQSLETYKRWYEAGAHRYLLRIETSNSDLYQQLHPNDHDFKARFQALKDLKNCGYQVGTGMMIGLPGQAMEDLAADILFMKNQNIDMIGMGPFIPHQNTPLSNSLGEFDAIRESQLELSLKMIAITRIVLKDVNIAATTALQALDPIGREKGLEAGANIIMPNITDTKYREGYQLYENKPCLDENSDKCKGCLEARITSIGEAIGYNEWGDSPHYFNRTEKKR
ncbi:MAG: [FeFe] hydrogenase H-cluster radical SAM maturase HydE [Candidatus Marinimicrobia bacterium]|nr:[FeFe] hydrogenase H-cluster radical SAM maturase HydE [Candidatus Neomarinimicrobiota bacterium]